MPPPKDPEKLKEYREKMRRIALERGYGKWMKGKTRTPESIEKTRQANVGKTISEEHRAALRTARQKEVGEGKELFGGEAGKEKRVATVREQRQGKTYEEIYGDRAEEEAPKRRDGNVGAHANRSPHPNRGLRAGRGQGKITRKFMDRSEPKRNLANAARLTKPCILSKIPTHRAGPNTAPTGAIPSGARRFSFETTLSVKAAVNEAESFRLITSNRGPTTRPCGTR